jgi:uncharacterized protein (TIGR02594 family)
LNEPGPKMLLEFIKIYGIKEAPGAIDNPVILSWAKEVGAQDYNHDEVPWCGLAMAVIAKRAQKDFNFQPLWAKNWSRFGQKVTDGPKLGDVLVYTRKGGGHVGLYIGEDKTCYHTGGGNQLNAVNIIRMEKSRLFSVRRPIYKVMPPNVRAIILSEEGEISTNEQ